MVDMDLSGMADMRENLVSTSIMIRIKVLPRDVIEKGLARSIAIWSRELSAVIGVRGWYLH